MSSARRKVTAVVLSAGAWSEASHLPALASHPEVDLLALSRPDAARAQASADRFSVPTAVTDWRDALILKPDIVVVSSPPVAHPEQVVAALEAGAHVLVEKPFALSLDDAQTMARVASTTGRQLLVAYSWTLSPLFTHAQTLIRDGHIGAVEHINMHLDVNTRDILSGSDEGGWPGSGDSQPATYVDPASSGGGVGAVTMSHELSVLTWLTGDSISAVAATTWPNPGLDLHAAALMRLSGGGQATVSAGSARRGIERPEWTATVHGSLGDLTIDSRNDYLRVVTEQAESVVTRAGTTDPFGPTRALVQAALGRGVPAGLTAATGCKVAAATDALYASAMSTTWVRTRPWMQS